jgi:hypothetical protein
MTGGGSDYSAPSSVNEKKLIQESMKWDRITKRKGCHHG